MKKIFLIFTLLSLFFEVSAAAAKPVKKSVKKDVKKVESPLAEKFIQINLSQNECEKFVNGAGKLECFRRDQMRDEPYYHQTRITILRNKIFAEQFSHDAEKPTDRAFLTVNNGTYKIKDQQANVISFSVKNGVVNGLKILQGNIAKERSGSSCQITEAIYGFYQAYDTSGITVNPKLYADAKKFAGLHDFFIFTEKTNPQVVMVMSSSANQTPVAIQNMTLCKMPKSENYNVKYFVNQECDPKSEESEFLECQKYKECVDYLVVKNCEALLMDAEANIL